MQPQGSFYRWLAYMDSKNEGNENGAQLARGAAVQVADEAASGHRRLWRASRDTNWILRVC
jgi:hypothetical protein